MSVKMSLRKYLEKEIISLLEISVQFVRKRKGIYFAEGSSSLLLQYRNHIIIYYMKEEKAGGEAIPQVAKFFMGF